MRLFQICFLGILALNMTSQAVVAAAGKQEIRGKELEREILIKNEAAQKVLDAYKKLDTYQAVWEIKLPQDAEQGKSIEIKVLFDRKTGNTACQMVSIDSGDANDTKKLNLLVIKNNNKLSVFGVGGSGFSPKPVIIDDMFCGPEITYRDIRRAITLFYPADLAMLMSDVPLHEILQGIPETCSIEISDTNNITLKLLSGFETDALMKIDPNTNLINEYCFLKKATGEKQQPILKLVSVKINEPIDAGLFDFDKYLEKYGIKKETKEPVKQ